MSQAISDEEYAARDYERWLYAMAFDREAEPKALLKRKLDCGHYIDGGEQYRYQVWRTNDMPRGAIHEWSECESCARGSISEQRQL